MVGIQLLQAFEREGWARAVAQQAFQPSPVFFVDAYRGVYRKVDV
jgi:hypothetical protein